MEIANATTRGLAAAAWTDDLSLALRVSKQLHAGSISIDTVDALELTRVSGVTSRPLILNPPIGLW